MEDKPATDKDPKPKLNLKKYAVTLAAGLILAFALSALLGVFDGTETAQKLCDAFFVSAALFLGIGGLTAMSGRGAYDGLSYTARGLNPFRRVRYQNYGDYKEKKDEERAKAPKRSFLPMLFTGAVLLLSAGICLIVYYS